MRIKSISHLRHLSSASSTPPLIPSKNLRHLSSASSTPPFLPSKNLRHVPVYYRQRVVHEAKSAIAEYFYATCSLSFSHAENIAANSPDCLSSFLSTIPFSSFSSFPREVRRHLAYRRINELDFFFESIGVSPEVGSECWRRREDWFLSEKSGILAVVTKLVQFGFPWKYLGVIYKEESSIFECGDGGGDDAVERLREFESSGLDRACVVGVCLAFPWVLAKDCDEVHLLLEDLKSAFGDFEFQGSMEENVEVCFRFCRRIRLFYDLGCKIGEMGDLFKSCWKVVSRLEERELVAKVDFLCKFGMEKEEAGVLLLRQPEILELDIDNVDIRMPDYLMKTGISEVELDVIQKNYPHALGRNKVANLSSVLRALGLSRWLIEKIKNGDLLCLSQDYLAYNTGSNEMDVIFQDGLQSVKASRRECSLPTKIEFLQGIGFGENKNTIRALRLLMGTRPHLQERFDCILEMGFEYSELCKMVSACPKILNQNPDTFRKKVDFLCNTLGLSVEYLYSFPAFLTFDLENRVKPRYRMLDWLRKNGLLKRYYSPASVVSTSEKKYIDYLKASHPAAPKIWLEVFKYNIPSDTYK